MNHPGNKLSKILAVDDNAINIEILKEILQDEFELVCVSSGEEALAAASELHPDIILLDIMMPGLDGYEVCRRIRSDAGLHRTKVIMVSAKAMVSERMAGYEAGANDYITKPFDRRELLAKVRVFLDLKSSDEVREARLAGMAEVASGVLHNVGNALNSISVSASVVRSRLDGPNAEGLDKVAEICCMHESEFVRFVSETERGQALPQFLKGLCERLSQDRKLACLELDRIRKSIQHVAQVIKVQQGCVGGRTSWDVVNPGDLVRDARELVVASGTSGTRIVEEFEEAWPVRTHTGQAVQILANLIKNAFEAVALVAEDERKIELRVSNHDDGQVRVEVEDNGTGIRAEDAARIFHHGFTTKDDGHGFGLHGAALAAKALGGALSVHSDGPNKGAVFTLILPAHGAGSEAA